MVDTLLLSPFCRQENKGLKGRLALGSHTEPGLCNQKPLLPPRKSEDSENLIDGDRIDRAGVPRGLVVNRGRRIWAWYLEDQSIDRVALTGYWEQGRGAVPWEQGLTGWRMVGKPCSGARLGWGLVLPGCSTGSGGAHPFSLLIREKRETDPLDLSWSSPADWESTGVSWVSKSARCIPFPDNPCNRLPRNSSRHGHPGHHAVSHPPPPLWPLPFPAPAS